MPQDHRSSKADFPLTEAQRLYEDLGNYKKVAKAIGWSQSQVYRKLTAADTSNGNLPAIPTPAHSNAPERISALPVHYDASALDDVRSRLATLEAFMAALQEQQRISALPAHPNAPAHRSAPERIEPPQWVSRGMHVSTDMLAAIDAYATHRRLEKRMALDELLRIAFAAVAEEVHDE